MPNSRLWVLSAASLLLVGTMTPAANALPDAALQGATTIAQAQQPAQDQNKPRQGRQRRRIDFAAAAARLNTTEANLRQALGLPAQAAAEGDRPDRPQRPSLQQAASHLNVSEERLRQALGVTVDPQTGRPVRPRTRPNLQQVASQLGVSEAQLRTALGVPADGERRSRPRLDIAGAAARLGVSEQQVMDALGIRARRMDGQRPSARPQSPTNQ